MPKSRIPLRDRFANLYIPEPNSGCWLWEGSLNELGYGMIWVNEGGGGGAEKAHRVSVLLSGRTIRPTEIVRHSCDTRCCVNPDHLLVGSTADNIRDRVTRGRSAIGERSGRARLTAADVLAIRAHPAGTRGLARRFGVNRSTINAIQSGKTWRHV